MSRPASSPRFPRVANLLRRFRRDRDGVAAIEMGLMAPLLALLLLGGFDVARYVLTVNKVMKLGFSVSDVTAQYASGSLNDTALQQIFRISGQNLPTYQSGTTGVTILTSVYLDTSTSTPTAKVRWQCFSSPGTSWSSKIGIAGATASIDKSLLLDANDNIIISEVYYKYTPTFTMFFKSSSDIYSKALFRPRLGALSTKPCS